MTIAHDTWLLTICKCDLLQHRFCEICFGSFKELGENWRPRVSFWMSCFQEQNKITAISSILWRRCRRALASCNIPSPLGVWTATKTSWAFDTHAKYFLFGMAFFQAMLNFQGVLLQRNECQLFGNWRESLLVWCKRLCMCNSDIQVAFIEDKQWTCMVPWFWWGFSGLDSPKNPKPPGPTWNPSWPAPQITDDRAYERSSWEMLHLGPLSEASNTLFSFFKIQFLKMMLSWKMIAFFCW